MSLRAKRSNLLKHFNAGDCFAALSVTATLLVAVLTVSTHAHAAEPAIKAPLAVKSLLLAGDQRGGHMVVVGERGHILISNDNGHNWQQADVPTRALLTNVFMHDAKLGWAVGHDATILKTDDGGLSWRQVFSAPEEEAPLLDLWFRDANYGLAVGAYGLMYQTEDGGEQWHQIWVNDTDDFHLNQINQAPDGTLYIAAEAGMIYRSDDEGATWETLDSPYHGSLFGSLASGNTLFIYGLRGHLFMSPDRGNHWDHVATDTTAMITSAIKRNSDCIFAGLGGTLLIDHQCEGKALQRQQLPGREGISDLLLSDQGELVLIGEHGVERYQP